MAMNSIINELINKLSKENRTIFLLGNLNAYLLNFDTHPPANEFLDLLLSHYFLPHTLKSARV